MPTLMTLAKELPCSEEAVQVFGVLLFTDEHAHIKKALDDDDYWKAFGEVSGPQWPVFAIRAKKGAVGRPDFPDGFIGYMVPVWKEPAENRTFLRELEIQDTRSLPLLVIFAKGVRGELMKREIRLPDDSQDAVYAGVKKALRIVASALEGVDEANRKNAPGVMQAVHMAVDYEEQWQKLKKGFGVYQWLKRMLPQP